MMIFLGKNLLLLTLSGPGFLCFVTLRKGRDDSRTIASNDNFEISDGRLFIFLRLIWRVRLECYSLWQCFGIDFKRDSEEYRKEIFPL